MLEAYKNIDGLTAAWRQVVRELPEALLVILGEGSRRDVVDELVAELPEQVEHIEQLLPEGVAAQMDRATVLVLPSRSEGPGARPGRVDGARTGDRRESRRRDPGRRADDREALLVEPGDVDELAAALVRVLADRPLAERLGSAAFERYQEWHTTPAEYAARVRSLVDASLRGAETMKAGR